ncbi:MAG: response regulator [Melioribacteraceae bacterium]|nr:response regulator [Melioribacteraceae bacterium]
MKKKVILIEDDLLLGENLKEILEKEFFVFHAEDGKQGIELIKNELPDLVISDILLPDISGHEVKQTLNSDPLLSMIPFIFLTAKADKTDIRRGMDLGADDYLTKPFSSQDLLNSIHSRLKKNEVFKKHTEELTKSIALCLPHELNNPLISILGYSEIIIDQAERCEYSHCSDISSSAKIVHSAGLELMEILRRYLLVVKLQMIYSDLDEVKNYNENKGETIDVRLLEAIVEKTAEEYDAARVILLKSLDKTRLDITLEDISLIVKEVIDNAFKFGDKDSKIIINIRIEEKFCRVDVKNTGRGMTEEQIANIGFFQQFERERYEQKGTGLGLAIATKLAELNGGRLSINSKLNEQTVVSVFIPVIEKWK